MKAKAGSSVFYRAEQNRSPEQQYENASSDEKKETG